MIPRGGSQPGIPGYEHAAVNAVCAVDRGSPVMAGQAELGNTPGLAYNGIKGGARIDRIACCPDRPVPERGGILVYYIGVYVMARQADLTSRPVFIAEIMRATGKFGKYFVRQKKDDEQYKQCLSLHTSHFL